MRRTASVLGSLPDYINVSEVRRDTAMTKKKILIIVENLPVPFDRRVWKEALALHQHGYEVSILSPRGNGFKKTHEVLDGIHVYRHPMPSEGNTRFGYLAEYAAALFWQTFFSWWVFITRGFHVIQGCNPPDDIFFVALPFRIFGVKFIFDHHDANPELYLAKYGRKDFLYKVQVWLEKLTYMSSDAVMATNESYRRIAIERGKLDPDDIYIVRNGPDLEKFRLVPKQPRLKYGKRFLVGYVGTISVQEGLDILVEAAARIRELGRTDVHFTCAGGGPGVPVLQQMVKDKKLDDTFNFTGRISDQDLLEMLSTADVCVNPDRPCEMNDISTMIKIAEYMALGKPIVQFDLKEGRFTAGEASLYCEGDDQVNDFADKVLWLLDHPEERQKMGEIGLRRVEQQLAWKYSVENLLAAYEGVFSSPAAEVAKATTADATAAEE
jgi:glycosyltransferase involved in cell wall biosynthesis